jgi:uncharacterized protein
MKLSSQQLSTIQDYFSAQPVLKAYLFGSYCRGNATINSDIDLLLDLDYSKPIGLEFVQMQMELKQLLNKEIDLVSSNGISKYIKPIIDAEKLLVYER